MIPSAAMLEVKKELETLFGKGLTGLIMISAIKKANLPSVMKQEHFSTLVDEICADERVNGMLGSAGSNQKSARWKQLVN